MMKCGRPAEPQVAAVGGLIVVRVWVPVWVWVCQSDEACVTYKLTAVINAVGNRVACSWDESVSGVGETRTAEGAACLR